MEISNIFFLKSKLFFLFLFVFLNTYGQVERYDLDLFLKKADSLCLINKRESFCKAIDFYKNKNYDSCYAYSNKALLENFGENESDILNYVQGTSAIRKRLYKKALSSFLSISENNEIKTLKLQKLGRVFLSLKNYDKAIFYYEKWSKKSSVTTLRLRKASYHNLGVCYMHTKKYDKAKEFFTKRLSLIEDRDTTGLITAKMELANVYYNQYLDDEAIPLFREAYLLSKGFSDIELKQNSSKNMAVVERNRKNYKESVGYYIEYGKWKDSIWNRDKIWELTERDKKLSLAQKQQEIAVQDEKLKRQKIQRDGLIIGSSGLLIFIGFLGLFYRKLKKKNKLITEQKEDLNVANKTKDYLFSVVSHDLRSPINTIRYQHEELKTHIDNKDLVAIKEATNAAIAVTNSTSHLLNNVLHWSLEQSNQLIFDQKEYALRPMVQHVLHDYTILVEAKSIRIESDLKNALVKADKESLKIVLRNLLDNAVKYMNGAGEIKVTSGVKSETEAFISIEDTGVGIPKDRLMKINALKDLSIDKIDRSEGVGLGLILCQTLIKKNNGTLTFDSEVGKGTKITILLPSIPV
ncbi:tetratricopeptide repeat-containing sensor histidine kinase [uncultured Tenacibaculum sp.]|uniref:tetratricopeptide repeat-containing sensor histidine kinase n=1 Tax=uncultured Tenacibaculum sp. TaxID=174713 RepID=UPI00260E84AC|nr:tetratricopeptide repeat-containing sensor histidine kinase [uncultured Tenacibaculum sp.]